MLVIRLFRTGKKNQPFFKIVVTDKRRPPKGGRFREVLGFVNTLKKEKGLKKERIKYWLSKGAQPSDTIYNLLIQEKILQGKKIPLHKKKKGEEKEGEKKEEKPEPARVPAEQAEAPAVPVQKAEAPVQEAEPKEKAEESKEKAEDKPEQKLEEKPKD